MSSVRPTRVSLPPPMSCVRASRHVARHTDCVNKRRENSTYERATSGLSFLGRGGTLQRCSLLILYFHPERCEAPFLCAHKTWGFFRSRLLMPTPRAASETVGGAVGCGSDKLIKSSKEPASCLLRELHLAGKTMQKRGKRDLSIRAKRCSIPVGSNSTSGSVPRQPPTRARDAQANHYAI